MAAIAQHILLVTLICCFTSFSFSQPASPLPKSKHDFIVIAHRGSHLLKAENTLEAISDAIALDVDYVEVDLRTTKDGRLVLCHDETVDRVSNGKGLVKEMDWSEISRLAIIGKDRKTYRIPEFEEVLALCKNKVNIYLDFKDANVELVYEQIKKAGMENQVLIYPNNEKQSLSWRKTAPRIPQIISLPDSVKTRDDLLHLLTKMQVDVVDSVTDSILLATLVENKISIFLDVQSKDEGPEKWENALKSEIQGLQSDHPKALIDYLHKIDLRRSNE